ncbi:hypothetical protein NDU88_002521 [Pleurodeles waltl]|uniref:Uncharacterized protein n=1 Tax=Pleurodeles waltl TaxID=8319 RepID=A0AAV7MNE4_PLEWA|nr:hypothetical protein NDU88_002521 [Pleurodeles waltl]
MRSGKIRKEYLTPQKPPQKHKKCHYAVTPPSPLASASVTSAAPLSSAADLSNSEIPKTYPSVALTPHPRSLDLHKSSLLSYFKKKPKLEVLVNGGDIKSELGQSTFTELAVIDPLPTAHGYSTIVAQVYCPASPTSPVFTQLAPQSEVCHPPLPVNQRAAPSLKHEPLPTIISRDHSLNPGEGASFLVESPATFHQLAGPDGQTADCHDSLQDQDIFLLSSPPAAQWIRNSSGSIHPILPLRSSSGAAQGSQTEFIKGDLNDQSLLDLSCLLSDSLSGVVKESNHVASPTLTETSSAWPQLLQTLHSTVLALNYHSDKLDVQVDLLNTLAFYVAGIDKKIENLNQLISRAQTSANYVKLTCCCSPTIESLSPFPTFLSSVVCEIKILNRLCHRHSCRILLIWFGGPSNRKY